MQQQALVPIDQARALVQDASKRGFLSGLDRETEKAIALVQEGFDPRFHLAVYQRRLIITADGMNWWLRRNDHLPVARVISDPIVSADERKAYGLDDDEIGVIAKVFVPGVAEPIAQGFGKASRRPYSYEAPGENDSQQVRDEAKGHRDRMRNPIEAQHPYRMAEKRAEAQAIRKAVPMGVAVPIREEVGVARETAGVFDAESKVVEEPSGPGAQDLLDSVGRYRKRIEAATSQGQLTPISHDITGDGALTQDDKVLLRRGIAARSNELVRK